MPNKTKLAIACGIVTMMAGAGFAQTEGAKATEQPKYFHLDFVLKELDGGKVVNARHYAMTISTGDTGTSGIRTGNKVPITTGGTGGEVTQFTYIDVGVNIDCKQAKEMGDDLALHVDAEISSAATQTHQPLIRQTKWSSSVIVPIGKATTIFSSDDVTTKGQMQLELTATPVR